MKNKKIWYRCPYCNQKILKYDELNASSNNLYIKCKKCNKEIEININE